MLKLKNNIFKNKKAAVVLAVVCTLLWGTAFPFIKLGYSAFEIPENDIGAKLLFAGLRFGLASVMVFAVAWITARRFPAIQRKDALPLTLLGLVQTAAQYILSYIGIGLTSSTNTSLITACASFFTVIFASLFFKNDKLNLTKVLGCVLGFAGVLAVNGAAGFSAQTAVGDFLILLSTISAASGNILSKKVATGRNPITVTAYQLLTGSLVLIFCGIILGGSLDFTNVTGVLILLWLAFVSAAAFSVWTALLKYHPASKISVFNLLVPVFGTLLSGVVLGEDVFKIEILISLILISSGIIAVNLSVDFFGKRSKK